MEQVKVTLSQLDCHDNDCTVMDKKFFKDMVYQAMYYPGSSITIGTRTLSGVTLLVKHGNQQGVKKYVGDLKKVAANLWKSAKCSKSIVFRSNFEEIEYLIKENL